MISTLSKKHSFDIVFDSQELYRLILQAMSNPGKSVYIGEFAEKLFGAHPLFLAIALTLLDNETGFAAVNETIFSNEISSRTLAKREPADTADFIFVSDPAHMPSVMESAKRGTAADPHKSALIIIQDDATDVCRIRLRGPGIDGCLDITATRTLKEAILLRDRQCYEYPQGVELMFISGGDMLCVPRSVKMEVL